MNKMFKWFLFLYLFILERSVTRSNFPLYYTDHINENTLYYDCLLFNTNTNYERNLIPDKIAFHSFETVPYCIRPFKLSFDLTVDNEKAIVHGKSITFEELKNANVTSEELYLLSAPIDVIERYQEYLESSNSTLSKQVFNNCSKPWFGQYCQYSFDSTCLFNDIVLKYFSLAHHREKYTFKNGTCYTFIECNRGGSSYCLDWREICDGKIDCFDDGQDEIGCEKLSLNECNDNEFRCNNGFCIPKEYFNDDTFRPDCMDLSDEKQAYGEHRTSGVQFCFTDPGFVCEQTTCRNERMLSCGDGQCSADECYSNRHIRLKFATLSRETNIHLSFECWTSLICITVSQYIRANLFDQMECTGLSEDENIFRKTCPTLFFFPAQPIILSHIRFAYATNLTNEYVVHRALPHYVCYDQELCDWLPATTFIDGLSCRHLSDLKLSEVSFEYSYNFESDLLAFFLKCSSTKNFYDKCPMSKPYRCANSSKCIALNRLIDGFQDCFQGDDEKITNSCSLPDSDRRFRCLSEDKCIPITSANSHKRMCAGGEDMREGVRGVNRTRFYVSFTTLCDGFVEHTKLDGLDYTDEMDCDYWFCNNSYTRCDRTWNCLNGIDEVNCSYNPCAPNGHPCISLLSHDFICLPISRINDGHIDCIGGFDEYTRCGPNQKVLHPSKFRCFNETKCISLFDLCYTDSKHCSSSIEEELFCQDITYISDVAMSLDKEDYAYFSLKNHHVYPSMQTIINTQKSNVIATTTVVRSNQVDEVCNSESISYELNIFCNRGIPIYRNDITNNISCLCPPAYFGFHCEYQNQRVSVTLQFRVANWKTIFTFVIMLIDESTQIHSSEQIDYLSGRDCQKKFNLYLLYATRKKHDNQTYYIRIDTFDKEKMKHYISMLYPIRYTFLPVHHLSLQVDVPMRDFTTKLKHCSVECLHGQCKYYSNINKYFCLCSDGYSGISCSIKITCDCSLGSICAGIVNNRSICICPLDKFGSRCYLKRTGCLSNECSKNGRCIPADEKTSTTKYYCLCSPGYSGWRCEDFATKIELNFNQILFIPQTFLIHFVYVREEHLPYKQFLPSDPIQTTKISKIKFHETSSSVYYAGEFDLIFVEFYRYYYLAVLQQNHRLKVNISTAIIPEYRCLDIKELLPHHIQILPRWHRAKYYHLSCQQHSKLACFYDNDYFMCLCDLDRHANCFKFDYQRNYNCLGYNYCENNGQCYLDNITCPTSSTCFCKECYYGSRCQFTTKGFGLSLDDILGYSIWPNVSFSKQPRIVKISAVITTIMFAIAIINSSVLSVITFKTRRSLQSGSGFYLLASSITSFLTIVVFTIKFVLLIVSQMSLSTNSSFLLSNCLCTDMFLKTFLVVGDWLNACVSIERVFTVRLGIKFNKITSETVAKKVIIGIYVFTMASFIHDPFHRHLLEDEEEQRRWCILRYSSSMQTYASFMNIFHFILPVSINFFSSALIIFLIAGRKAATQRHERYRAHLLTQFHQHKHRLLSSFVLVIITIPRLILSFVYQCMRSPQHPWLYLSGYFISFFPSLLIFTLFVLPSKFYMKEFHQAILRIRNSIQNRLQSA